jgi:asparagine synthase (glutamine-hydrolysing)
MECDWSSDVCSSDLGVSALFHIKLGEQVFFASDTATILSVISKDVEIDYGVFYRYAQLGTYPEGGRTLISGLQYINNAEYVAYDNQLKKKSCSYWSLENIPPIRFHFEEDYVHGLFSVYSAAVRPRLHTDKEIGLFLSRGLDCTSVASLAAFELQTKGRTLNTYTSFPHYESMLPVSDKIMANEVPLVQDLAKRYKNLRPYFFDFPDASLKDQFDEVQALDAYYPMVSKNSFWLNGIMSQASKNGISRMLTGQLGNYTITWTSSYVYALLFYQFRFRELFKVVKRDLHGSNNNILIFIIKNILWQSKARFSSVFFTDHQQNSQTVKSYINKTYLERVNFSKHSQCHRRILLKKLFLGSSKNNQRVNDLGKLIPFAGIRWALDAQRKGLEVTEPTADSRLVHYTLSIPEDLFYRVGFPKYIFKLLMEQFLPNSILENRRINLQSFDFPFRFKNDKKFNDLFYKELLSPDLCLCVDTIQLDELYQTINSNPEKFISGINTKVFLNFFSLQRFFNRNL